MAHVLILSVVFPPDGVSTAHLMGELAEDLTKAGHQVSVISTQPHYNRDSVAQAEQPLRPYWRRFLYESDFRGIRVLHTAMPAKRGGFVQRLVGWMSFHLLGLAAGLRSIPAPDVIIVPSPLLTAGIVAWGIGSARGGRYIYNVQELYPDLAVQMGWIRNPFLIRILQRLERLVYAKADFTTGISKGICQRILEKGVPSAKVRMIPNFVDIERMAPLPKENDFRREFGLDGTFVVSYAGNMGLAQGLDTLVDVAELLRTENGIRFVLVGDGVLHRELKRRVQEQRMDNMEVIGHQPYARMPEIYAASDACLVPLLGEAGGTALPSKVFRIMACARPVLAICDPDSELAEVIQDAGAGLVVPPGESGLLAEAVRELAREPERCAAMGAAGRHFVKEQYTRSTITRKYAELVDLVVSSAR